jgi:hypothetical protein
VQLTHLDEESEAQMLVPIQPVPSSCSRKFREFNHTIWTQLDNNEWMDICCPLVLSRNGAVFETRTDGYYATGNWKIKSSTCKACGSWIVIYAHATRINNSTSKDIFPPLSLQYDCCESGDQNFKFNEWRWPSLIFVIFRNGNKSTFYVLMSLCFPKCCRKRCPKF